MIARGVSVSVGDIDQFHPIEDTPDNNDARIGTLKEISTFSTSGSPSVCVGFLWWFLKWTRFPLQVNIMYTPGVQGPIFQDHS